MATAARIQGLRLFASLGGSPLRSRSSPVMGQACQRRRLVPPRPRISAALVGLVPPTHKSVDGDSVAEVDGLRVSGPSCTDRTHRTASWTFQRGADDGNRTRINSLGMGQMALRAAGLLSGSHLLVLRLGDRIGRGPSTCQSLICCQQHKACPMREFYVEGIGDAETVATRPCSGKQWREIVPGHGCLFQLVQCRIHVGNGQHAGAVHAAKCRQHFGVEVCRRVHDGVG